MPPRCAPADAAVHPPIGRAVAWWAWVRVLLAVPLLALWLGGQTGPARAQAAVPALQGRVMDLTGDTLSATERNALDGRLAAFEAEAGPQIAVLIVASTAPEDLASYAWRVADTWKIGRRDVGDGLLIVVARDDRRVRIEVAKALEGAIPDLAARQIIDRHLRPAFREGRYAAGLEAGLDALMQRLRGEHLPAPEATATTDDGPAWDELAVFFFMGVPVIGTVLTAMMGRRLGSLLTGGVAGGIAGMVSASLWLGLGVGLAALLLVGLIGTGSARRAVGHHRSGSVPWPGGWSGGSDGASHGGEAGGGFSSGGGGDFGGGGASGDW